MKRYTLLAFILIFGFTIFFQLKLMQTPLIPVNFNGSLIPLEEQIDNLNSDSSSILQLTQGHLLRSLFDESYELKNTPIFKPPHSLIPLLSNDSAQILNWNQLDQKLNKALINDLHQTLLMDQTSFPELSFALDLSSTQYPWSKRQVELGNSASKLNHKELEDLTKLICYMQLIDGIDQIIRGELNFDRHPAYSLFLSLPSLRKSLKFNLFELRSILEVGDNYTLNFDLHFIDQLRSSFIKDQTRGPLLLEKAFHHYLKKKQGPFRFWQLQARRFYTKLNAPLVSIALFSLAIVFCIISQSIRLNILTYSMAIYSGWALLILRSFILMRPPVSSMLETYYFVAAILSSAGFYFLIQNHKNPAIGSALLCLILYTFAYTFYQHELNPLQPILASNFWLATHVLMVVSSYAFFILAGLIAHILLLQKGRIKKTSSLYCSILNLLMAGVFFLSTGTLLGGVWASQSWGRFWDWDPKEAWAFISICYYLVIIHASYFNKLSPIGITYAAIGGLVTISFTWYGVNYILGAGLHSYGFGEGSLPGYLLYLIIELIFCTYCYLRKQRCEV